MDIEMLRRRLLEPLYSQRGFIAPPSNIASLDFDRQITRRAYLQHPHARNDIRRVYGIGNWFALGDPSWTIREYPPL